MSESKHVTARLSLCLLGALAATALFAQTPLIDEGRGALSRGDSDAAIGLLEKAVAQSPRSAEAHFFLGSAYAAAFAEFEAALKLDPTYMAGFYHLGRTAALANTNLARGEEAMKKYLAYTPKENEPPLANAHFYLGGIYENQGKKPEARQSY